MATNKRTLSRIGFYCGLALFLIITLFPFFVMLMTSFKGAKEAISLHPTLLPQQWTLEHYVDIFNPMIFPFVDYFRNSLVVSVVSSVVAVFLGILGAYALSRLRFKGRMTINASFYTVYMFSGILLVVPLFKIITALGIYVNEQNEQAVGFYKKVGFKVTGRSEVDDLGKPYPLLNLAYVGE